MIVFASATVYTPCPAAPKVDNRQGCTPDVHAPDVQRGAQAALGARRGDLATYSYTESQMAERLLPLLHEAAQALRRLL